MDTEKTNASTDDTLNADDTRDSAVTADAQDSAEAVKPQDSAGAAAEGSAGDQGENKEKKGGLASSVYDVAEMFAICATVVLLLFTFVARLTVVDGGSMEQTLHEGEFMLIRSVAYKPQRGDIVVIDDPTAGPYAHPLIKRVIAVGGDTVDIDFSTWTVTVNGEVLDESAYRYLDPNARLTAEYEFPITIEEGHIFVMGDNRHHSADSRLRVIGQIDERCVVGKAALRVLPFSRITLFS